MLTQYIWCVVALLISGCTIKAVGDPNKPITIEAHVTVDFKGLKDTASNIEDYVSGKNENIPVAKNK